MRLVPPSLSRERLVLEAVAVATGISLGVLVGFLLTDRDPTVLLASMVVISAALLISALLIGRSAWRDVLPMIALAMILRAGIAVVLFDALVAAGRGGFVTGDDALYADLSSRLARILHNDPAPFHYSAESYLLGTFVYLETAIFYLLGPKVLIVELLNAAMGGLLVALVYDIARRLFLDVRTAMIAAVLVAFYPSLVLWSALNLKDSLALLLIAIVLWLVVVFHTRRSWWLVPAIFVPVLLMEGLRGYIFVGLALVVPISVAVTRGTRLRERLLSSGLAFGLSALLLAVHFGDLGPGPDPGVVGLESQRGAMGIGANTRFADPAIEVEQQATYVISAPSVAASLSPFASPTATPRVVVVAPGTRLLVSTGAPNSSPSAGVVMVRPGDVVVVGGANATPAAPAQRKPLNIAPSSGTVELVSESDSKLIRTVRYLPRGATFVLLAPFPWSVARPLEVLPIPEMLVWYFALPSAVVTIIRQRRRWRTLTPLVLFVGGTLLVLVLAEGNVGTVFRHRAMVIPFVLILASPVFALALLAIRAVRTNFVGALAVSERRD